MSRKMLINASHPEENRVAIVVDGTLSELDIEIAGQEQSKGNIYKAVVVRVETGLQAAFVDYGAEKLGFLQIGEIHPNLYPPKNESKDRPRIADILKRGQEILVQIVKEERGNKGAALTTYLSIPGRYMVLMPDSATKGVSRKINDDAERKKLKRTMAELDLPEKMGYIVRTAGIGKEQEELKRDFDYLVRLYEGIVARKDQIKAPAQLYQESNLAIRSIRDYFATDMDEVLIDSQQVFQDAKDFFSLVMPELRHLVKRHRERRPIFSRYQIEEQIEGLAKSQTPLPSGGSIVIDQTEALVAIDVNSGKMASESGIEATALKTNLEAAVEVGRQLRLRDLGGLVVIDFIDMRDRKNIREVEQQLKKALKNDKAKVSVGRISQFGLMEMSRQRLKPTLSVGSFNECPHCKGAGKIRSVEAQAVSLLRQIHAAASKGQIGLIEVQVPIDVANYLLNQKRSTVTDMERQLSLDLTISGRADMIPGDLELNLHKKEKKQEDSRQIAPVSHANQIEVALAAANQEEQTPLSETADTVDSTTDGGTEEAPTAAEAPKKRRRRRRRKPASTEQSQEKTDGTAAEAPQETASDEKKESAAEQPGTSTEATTVEKSSDQSEEKPKRRSRRPARRKPAESTQKASTDTTDASESAKTTADESSPQTKSSETGIAVETSSEKEVVKKAPAKRTRRKPQPKKTTTETNGSQVAAEPAQSTTDPQPQQTSEGEAAPAAVAPAETTGSVTTEKAKRPRRTPRKKTSPAAEATETPATEEKKTRSRARKAPAKSVQASETENTEATPASATKTEQKPKRTTRKTAPGKAADSTDPSQGAETAATRTGRKKAAPKQVVSSATAPESATGEVKEESPKPKATRSRRTTTRAKKDPQTQENVDGQEDKPKAKPRRPRAKATADKQEEVKVASTDQEKAEKPKRRSPRKKTEEKTE